MQDKIIVKGAREHNLKNIDVEIPKFQLVVVTGLSGSGKSSLAFDTIYAEGQRRYVESLSSYARQFLGVMKKPDVDLIEGLSPAISIDQKGVSHNPRSTVGTVTEIYDYLRLLFARIGHPHCPNCDREISHLTAEQIVNEIISKFLDITPTKISVLAPLVKARKGEYQGLFLDLKKRGFQRIRIDGQTFSLDNNDLVLIKTNKHTIEVVIDRLILEKKSLDKQRLTEAVEQALALGNREMIVSKIKDKAFSFPEKPTFFEDFLFSEKFACPVCNISIQEIEPRMFSFNSPFGACEVCNGLGNIYEIDQDIVINPELTISEGGILPYQDIINKDTWFIRTLKQVFAQNGIPTNVRIKKLSHEQREIILFGTSSRTYEVIGTNRFGKKTAILETFDGVVNDLLRRFNASDSEIIKREIEKFMTKKVCHKCNGSRLKKEAIGVTIFAKSIVDVTDESIKNCLKFTEELGNNLSAREKEISRLILKEINLRLKFLVDVGLAYLTLGRSADSLSGGEAQRIRLASQIGSSLSGVLYVLDEPSIGLHQKDNKKLISSLQKLKELGNSIIVVEHDREIMEDSDYIIDLGPGAGEQGGKIVAQGSVIQIKNNPNSVTGPYLSNKKIINIKKTGQDLLSQLKLKLSGASQHNLKNIDVELPLKKFICVTGVSGSGKSTLVNDILFHALMQKQNPYHKEKPGKFKNLEGAENIKRVYMIDQSPIGRTPRSNPVTYTGAFFYIREIFANCKEARIRGYAPGRFSFNVKGGRCEACEGEGQIKIEMQFLPDVYITCEVCNGKRYTADTLEVEFEGKNIADVLNMTAREASNFFSFHSALKNKLATLNDVGLSYIKLGQPATTLSGGEAQRIKLASELAKRGEGASVYLLDEPTTGLHFADLEKLIGVLRRLVDMGNTVIVIEHNLDLIKNSDYIIDLGPEGGDKGGFVVAVGSPFEVSKNKNSYTGEYLKQVI